jgi:hypothetical protein
MVTSSQMVMAKEMTLMMSINLELTLEELVATLKKQSSIMRRDTRLMKKDYLDLVRIDQIEAKWSRLFGAQVI